jgi:hypothetical protein
MTKRKSREQAPSATELFPELLKEVTVPYPDSRLGKRLFARAHCSEDDDVGPLDYGVTMLDPIRLQQLCNLDAGVQGALAQAARSGYSSGSMSRVERAVSKVFENKLLVEIVDFFEEIKPIIAVTLSEQFAYKEDDDGDQT